MWINEDIDALVKYTNGVQFPILQAIRWGTRRIDLHPVAHVERTTMSLTYRCTDGLSRYSIRFEPARQRWCLEAIDDSGLHEEEDDISSPTVPPSAFS